MADNSIALGIQPMATPDYAGATMNRLNMLSNLAKLDQSNRQISQQNAFSQLLKDPSFDISQRQYQNQAFATGAPGAADLAQATAQLGANAARSAETTQKGTVEGIKIFGNHLVDLINDPTPSDEKLDLFASDMLKLNIPPNVVTAEVDKYKRLPLEQRQAAIKQNAQTNPDTLKALEFVSPKPVEIRLGDRVAMIDGNPNSPTYNNEIKNLTMGMSPEQTAAANLAQYKAQYPELVINITPSGSVIGTNPRTGVSYALPVMQGSPPPMPGVPGAAAPGGGIPTGRAAAPAGVFGSAIDQAVNAAIPNAAVSSAGRTPEKNAAVGGVPTSFHLTNDARDYTNFPGMTLAQGAAQLKQTLEPQGYQVIYGTPGHLDHVHVEPGPALAARAPAAAVPAAVPAAAAPAVPATAGSFVNTTQLDKQTSARDVLKAIGYDQKTGDNVVSSLIPQSTSGILQTGVNAMKGAFTGTSTPGGEAAAALEGLVNRLTVDLAGGKLGVGFSDADREAIKSTLGDAGNKLKPWNERQAAWNAAIKVIVRNAGYDQVKIPSPKPTSTAAGKNGVDLNNPLFHKKPGA